MYSPVLRNKSVFWIILSLSSFGKCIAFPPKFDSSSELLEGVPEDLPLIEDLASFDGGISEKGFSEYKTTSHLIEDECVTISMDEGSFHHKSKGKSEACGVYLIADPGKLILVTVDYMNAPCSAGALLSMVDGWELNGELFPSPEDHELKDERFHDLCGSPRGGPSRKSFYLSSQNAALLQYKLPGNGQGFSITVKHLPNPQPCNILVQDTDAVYTLRNHGLGRNCSLTTLFDAKIRVHFLRTGIPRLPNRNRVLGSLGGGHVLHKCGKLGMRDYVQLGGSWGLDTSQMSTIDEFCGFQPYPSRGSTTIICGMTTVRLVSSGQFENRIDVHVKKAELEDNPNYICSMK